MTEMRIGDAEREQAASALGEHYAAGRLSKDEFEQRVEQIWAARFDTDLEPMFADLPSPRPAGRPVAAPVRTAQLLPRTSPVFLPLIPVLFIALIAAAVSTGMPWLLFALFWLCALTGGGSRRAWRRQVYQRQR